MLICLSLVYASGESSSRSVPTPVCINTAKTISLTINPGTSTYYMVDEVIPSGWTVTSASDSGDYSTNPGHIFWVVMSGAATKTYTYTVNTGSGTGTKIFNGKVGFEFIPAGQSIGGTTNVDVQSSGCDVVCNCGSWSTCSSNCLQTRTCTPSGCNTESQSCTGGNCNPGTGTIVTRSLSSETPGKSTDITISLAVDVASGDTYYMIDEVVPSGLTISQVSGSGDYTTNPGHIFWVVMSGAQDITYTYKLNTGSSTGTKTFSGTYGSEIKPAGTAILGTNSFTVNDVSCTTGAEQDCVVVVGTTNCPGTQTCTSGVWGTCVKDDANCGTTGCVTGDACTVVVNGVDCAGTKVCTDGAQVSCTKTVSTCGVTGPVCTPECQFFEECKEQTDKTTKCEIATWVFIVGGVMLFFMFFSMMK